VLLVTALAYVEAQEKFFATFEYVTPYPVGAVPWNSYYYVAYLCNQALYNGKIATLSINLPYASWDYDSLNVVFVYVYSTQAMAPSDLVATNVGGDGRPKPNVTWIYNVSRGDSNLWVAYSVQGLITTLTYTSSLAFSDPSPNYVPTTFKPAYSASNQVATWTSYREIIKGERTYQIQTGPSSKPIPLLIDFSYCPPPDVTSYTLVVQVVAADTKSPMSLYICLPDKLPCSAVNSDQSRQDPAGIAVATVMLPTNTAQYKFLEAAVYGVGEFNSMNTFYFVVSTTK